MQRAQRSVLSKGSMLAGLAESRSEYPYVTTRTKVREIRGYEYNYPNLSRLACTGGLKTREECSRC